jgi:Rrf2 family protein
MDLRLTRRGDYAVRAALCLAGSWGASPERYLKIREIASAMEIPASYTPHVLKLLATADLAEAKAGPDGGYRLRASPGEITLLQVVEAAEGEVVLERCILRGGPCHWREACAVHAAWFGVVPPPGARP